MPAVLMHRSQAGILNKEKPTLAQTPMKKIFTSVPFISLVLCHFGNMFLLFFYQNSMTQYLTKSLGFKLTKGGALASLPWAGRMLFGFFFSWIGDTIKRRQYISITWLRKFATIFCKPLTTLSSYYHLLNIKFLTHLYIF